MVSSIKYQVSSMTGAKIKGFTDLIAWQEGHKLALSVYKITKTFPSDEKFGMIDQMRRAAVSITSNIAEGFSRSTGPDKSRFYDTSLGSTTEIQNQLILSRDLHYIENDTFQKLAEQSVSVHKLIFSLIKAVANGKGVRPKHT